MGMEDGFFIGHEIEYCLFIHCKDFEANLFLHPIIQPVILTLMEVIYLLTVQTTFWTGRPTLCVNRSRREDRRLTWLICWHTVSVSDPINYRVFNNISGGPGRRAHYEILWQQAGLRDKCVSDWRGGQAEQQSHPHPACPGGPALPILVGSPHKTAASTLP